MAHAPAKSLRAGLAAVERCAFDRTTPLVAGVGRARRQGAVPPDAKLAELARMLLATQQGSCASAAPACIEALADAAAIWQPSSYPG
jgi:hypothetical protein